MDKINKITTSKQTTMYDHLCKMIIGNEEVLSRIIKVVVDEAKHLSIEEIRRLIKGKSIKAVFKPDKGHLHHKLVAKGFTQKQAVLILYGLSASLGMFAIILFDSGIWKALSFLLMIIAAVALGYRNFIKEKQTKPKMIDNK